MLGLPLRLTQVNKVLVISKASGLTIHKTALMVWHGTKQRSLPSSFNLHPGTPTTVLLKSNLSSGESPKFGEGTADCRAYALGAKPQ